MDAVLTPLSSPLPRSFRWHYPRHHPWFITLAGLDVVLTWIILSLGGQELNAVAQLAINIGGVKGLIALKLAAVITVCAICEYTGRTRPRLGLGVANFAIAANTVPVAVACLALSQFALGLMDG